MHTAVTLRSFWITVRCHAGSTTTFTRAVTVHWFTPAVQVAVCWFTHCVLYTHAPFCRLPRCRTRLPATHGFLTHTGYRLFDGLHAHFHLPGSTYGYGLRFAAHHTVAHRAFLPATVTRIALCHTRVSHTVWFCRGSAFPRLRVHTCGCHTVVHRTTAWVHVYRLPHALPTATVTVPLRWFTLHTRTVFWTAAYSAFTFISPHAVLRLPLPTFAVAFYYLHTLRFTYARCVLPHARVLVGSYLHVYSSSLHCGSACGYTPRRSVTHGCLPLPFTYVTYTLYTHIPLVHYAHVCLTPIRSFCYRVTHVPHTHARARIRFCTAGYRRYGYLPVTVTFAFACGCRSLFITRLVAGSCVLRCLLRSLYLDTHTLTRLLYRSRVAHCGYGSALPFTGSVPAVTVVRFTHAVTCAVTYIPCARLLATHGYLPRLHRYGWVTLRFTFTFTFTFCRVAGY